MRERLAFPSRLLQGLRQLVQLKQATNFPAVNELPCCKLVRKQFWRIDPHQYFLRWNKNTRGWLRITKKARAGSGKQRGHLHSPSGGGTILASVVRSAIPSFLAISSDPEVLTGLMWS